MPIRAVALFSCLGLAGAAFAAPDADADAAAPSGGDAAFDGYARQMSALVNRYRRDRNLSPLPLDRTLVSLAAGHSAAMAKAGRMGHDDFPARTRRSGFALCIENVGWNYPTSRDQFDAWRASPGHDRNLLDPRVERVGIAATAGYVTLIACGK